MQGNLSRRSRPSGMLATEREWANEEPQAVWPDTPAGRTASKAQLSRLAHAIEVDIIPRLVQAHGASAAHPPFAFDPPALPVIDVDRFVRLITEVGEVEAIAVVGQLRDGGVPVESLYLDLFGPTARRLGELWEQDLCDFSTITVALGRLQRLLRELSSAFGREVSHPPNGRRALFVQPRDEQHSFGLSMVAEFFRRDGWDVIGGVGGAVANPRDRVREEWVDIIGFSVGSDGRLPWLQETIVGVRAASRNLALVVLVGGPPFLAHPEWTVEVGADGTARDGKEASLVAERLIGRGNLHIA